MAKQAGIYVRVSRDREGDEVSTARQEADCRKLCDLRGWDVAEVYRDTDTSAFTLGVERPAYERLVADLKGGRLNTVVIWKLDRLARRTRDVADFLDLLEPLGADLASVEDSYIDTSGPTGRLVIEIMAAVAQLESTNTSQRVRRAMREAAEAGEPHMGGFRPYGWLPDRKTIDPVEADFLRELVRRFLDEGEPLYRVLRDLEKRGMRTSTGRGVRQQTARHMLTSPRLAGFRAHKGELHPGAWEPIVDLDTWRRIQERFGIEVVEDASAPVGLRIVPRGTGRKRASGARFLLTGFVYCGVCGERMRMQISKGRPRYACYAACTSIEAPLTEERVSREVLTVLYGRQMVGESSSADELRAELDGVAARQQRLAQLHFVEDHLGEDEYLAARAPLAKRRADLEGQLLQVEKMRSTVPVGQHRDSYDEWWDAASLDERRRVLRGAVARVTVGPAVSTKGVPKALWQQQASERIRVEFVPEVVGGTAPRSDEDEVD